jgi:hypothetical protein
MALIDIAMAEGAFAGWKSDVSGNDEEAIATEARFRSELIQLQADLAEDAFRRVANRASALRAAAHDDRERRRDRAFILAARRAEERRSVRLTARSILDRCKKAGVEVTASEQRILRALTNGDASSDAEKTVAEILDRITRASEAKAQAARAAFLGSLGGGTTTSAADVLSRLRALFVDSRVPLIDRHLAELREYGENTKADQFSRRIEDTLAETGGHCEGRASLVVDTIGSEVSAALKEARAIDQLRRELEQELSAATALQDLDALQSHVAAARVAIQDKDKAVARVRLDELRTAREARQRARSAANARRVVLEGLRELGYEVREGMVHVLAEKKRIVVRHSVNKGQAVELQGSAEDGRLQARAVAIAGESLGGKSDKQVEEGWCSEFEKLQQKLAKAGGEITVEKSVPAGASPLKVVPNEWSDDEHRAAKPKEKRQS